MMKKIHIIILLLLSIFTLVSCDEIPQEKERIEIGTFERLFEDVKYRKITIEVTQTALDDLSHALLEHEARFGSLKTSEYIKANMTYEDDAGSLEIDNIGLRTRGNLSLTYLYDENGNLNMNSFKISFREEFGGANPENDGRRGFDLKELDMKWNRNEDATYMTEKYALDMMDHFGVFVAHTTHFILNFVIDGEEVMMGLYTGFEPIDDEFIERRFSKEANDGDLYKSLWQNYGPATLEPITNQDAIGIRNVSTNYRPSYDLKTNKKTSDHSALKSFIRQINDLNGDDFINYMESNFEIEMFIRLLAVNAFIGNPDDYRAMGNNYYLYQNSETGKWMMIPYDFDHGLGQGWWESNVYPNYSIGVDVYQWFDLNDALMNADYKHPLVDKLLVNDTYRTMYTNVLQEILDDSYFTESEFVNKHEALKAVFENTFDEARFNQTFGLRNAVIYINDKRSDINNQIK